MTFSVHIEADLDPAEQYDIKYGHRGWPHRVQRIRYIPRTGEVWVFIVRVYSTGRTSANAFGVRSHLMAVPEPVRAALIQHAGVGSVGAVTR